jgi:DNA-binding transcriptional MerR regulator
MKIGDVARELGIHSETIRRLERQGVIPKPQRDGIGRRFYDDDTIAVLRARYAPRREEQPSK